MPDVFSLSQAEAEKVIASTPLKLELFYDVAVAVSLLTPRQLATHRCIILTRERKSRMKPKPNYIEYERTIYQESLHRDYPTLQHALYPLHAGRCRIRGYPFETYKQPAAACQAYSPFQHHGRRAVAYVRAIRHILERVRAYGITVNDFYIVTNGSATSRSEEFIEACAALYEYQEEKEQDSGHMLEMSDDRFHDPAEHAATLAALSPYPFFGVRGQAERIFLFREGRSTEGFPNLFMGFILRRRLRLRRPLSQC